MCGIFGAIGPNISVGTVRCLAVMNESRGHDATGFYTSSKEGNWYKNNDRASLFLREEKLREWLNASAKNCWALMGHTRGGTRGGNSVKNAHPFEYGPICGAHNGVISNAPNKYDVDSQWAMELLSQHPPGEYQKALAECEGWYVLVWFDQRDQTVYMLNWTGDIWYSGADDSGTVYYSSDGLHLATATGYPKAFNLKHGKVVRFRFKGGAVKWRELPDFEGKKRAFVPVDCDNGQYWRPQGGISNTTAGSARQDRFIFQPPKGNDSYDITGWVRKFKNGLWHAERFDCRFRNISGHGQDYINKRFPDTEPFAQLLFGNTKENMKILEDMLIGTRYGGSAVSETEAGAISTTVETGPTVVTEPKILGFATPSQLKSEAEQEKEQREAFMKGLDMDYEMQKQRRIRRQALENEGKSWMEINDIMEREGLFDTLGCYD